MRDRLHAPATRIANARGVPGTLGCLALTIGEGQLVLLSAHHVLFGGGAREQEPVWRIGQAGADARVHLGRSLYGRAGVVRHRDADVYVDCAAALLEPSTMEPAEWCPEEDDGHDAPRLVAGDRVLKTGGATGLTEGIVVDVARTERARASGRSHDAPGQIAVRSRTPGRAFSAYGDSGAALRTADGAVVGLLWGRNARGESVACPIAPVLWVLHARLARRAPTATSLAMVS